MRFYDREQEIKELRAIRERSRTTAQWTVVTGRRRVGKTALVQTALGDEPYLYFYVARKTEAFLAAVPQWRDFRITRAGLSMDDM